MEFPDGIPPLLIEFALTVAFSFVVGLEFRRYQRTNQYKFHFGSTRTFVLIGLLGFILHAIDATHVLFGVGLFLLGGMLLIYYWRLSSEGMLSLFSVLLALLIYVTGPIVSIFPRWFLILFIVLLILILGEKPLIHRISDKLASEEIVTLAKFLVISGVILPLLPDEPIAPVMPVTYDKIWLAVIIVSGFSYLSYLVNTYFFKSRSLMITGVLGGLYSSTVATVVIGRRAHHLAEAAPFVSSALIMATAMMYIRLLIIILLFAPVAGQRLLAPFLAAILLSVCTVFALLRFKADSSQPSEVNIIEHPLELSTAIVFALSFMIFTSITQFVTSNYGGRGLNFLSIIVGFTDIDPFILSLLSGEFTVSDSAIVSAVILASGSNNLLKAIYAVVLARNRSVRAAAVWLIFLFTVSILYAFKINA
ncbi:MgtC/SapB family protein [Methylobacter sp.]|uniref:MgtC/SapB family protein n=1 Tax=Methylobacter sp. TaxID=2051955 RepID=UPI003DA1F259